MNEDLRKLRKKIDSNEGFMSHGHQIKKVRTRAKVIPDWAVNNKKTRVLLLSVFPKLHTNTKQRRAAARWAQVITLYYKLGMPRNQVAAEIGVTRETFKSFIRNIRRAARGLTPNNKVRGLRPRGRPGKEAPSRTPSAV